MFYVHWEQWFHGLSFQLKAGSFLLRKKAGKICLISIKFNEAIFEPQAICNEVNRWPFCPGISLYFLSICNLYIASAIMLHDGKQCSLHAFLILNILKHLSIWLIFKTLIPSSSTTFLKFYSFHKFLYKGCSMALGESCVTKKWHRESCHHTHFFFTRKKKNSSGHVFYNSFLEIFQFHAGSFAKGVL